ncbi:MAG: hypothetical protein PF638_11955 [Candidatus Delongbacteria bacterium]|jgi:hypothetical protein|nr:hypothetical protein [Candidatus Delongbacteria bacterium]
MNVDTETKRLILQRIAFMANSGKSFDKISIALRKYFGIRQKYSYQRIPDKILHYIYDYFLFLQKGKKIQNIGNAFETMLDNDMKFEQHPIHRGFYYDKSRHSLVGIATGIDINVSNGKHHIIELNRSIGILENIRPIYSTRYSPEILNIVKFMKEFEFKKVYVMYSRLHLYRKEIIEASAEFKVKMIPISYPWVEFDKQSYNRHFMPDTLERDTVYMRLEPGYSPIMHYLSDKYVSYKWLSKIYTQSPEEYSLLNIPKTTNYLSIDKSNYSEKWPNTVIKLSGKMQGLAVAMLKAESEEKALIELKIKNRNEVPMIFKSTLVDKVVDKLFGNTKTVIYQDFVKPTIKNDRAGRIRLNIFSNPLKTISLSDYYMWTVFKTPDICLDGLLVDPSPYIVNWAFSGQKAQFSELTSSERQLTDPAIPQICQLVQKGLEQKFITKG